MPIRLIRIPSFRISFTTFWAKLGSGSLVFGSTTNSAPKKRPDPRTSPMQKYLSDKSFKRSREWDPTSRALSTNSSSTIISKTASPAAHATGFPPKVLKYRKSVKHSTDWSVNLISKRSFLWPWGSDPPSPPQGKPKFYEISKLFLIFYNIF